MIVQKEFLNKLKDFGLNTYEAKLWTALLSRGISTAGELSDIANVPRSRSYDVLESLEKKGFIIMKLGKPIKYIAVPPEEVLERVKRRIQEDAESQDRLIEELRRSNVLDDLNFLHTEGINLVDPSELSGIIKGRTNIYHHLESMLKGAEKSVLIVASPQGMLRKMGALKNPLKKAKDRGVKMSFCVVGPQPAPKQLSALEAYGEIRGVKDMIGRFCIIDGKEITFMLLDDEKVHPSYDVGVWIKTPFFAKTMESSFSRVWKESKKL
jgi:HTH-type transcriptional regulator, sugar sensing transcriptional regulator